MIYKLTEKGRAMKWTQWCKIGGGGLCGYSIHDIASELKKRGAKFDLRQFTLGEIADMSPLAERSLASFANREFKQKLLSEPRDAA